MNKSEFIAALDQAIGKIPEQAKKEILYDYEEHFSVGLEMGKTEEEIASALGDPKQIARQFRAECALREAEGSSSLGNVFRAVFAAVGLGFFNLIFVLGPFLFAVGLILGLFIAAAGILFAGLVMIIAVMVSPLLPNLISMDMNPAIVFFLGTGTTSLGLLCNILVYYLIKAFFKATLSYLKMNTRIITNRRKEYA